MKHEIGELWKEGRLWKIQMPLGIQTVKTKREALLWSNNAQEQAGILATPYSLVQPPYRDDKRKGTL